MPFPNPDTQFKPGNNANPGGRPRGRSLTALLREALNRDTGNGKTVADAVVAVLLRVALEGDRQAIKDVFDRVEGKVTTPAEDPAAPTKPRLNVPDKDERPRAIDPG